MFDLINQRFGKLVILYPTKERKHCCIVWQCICDCGNKHKVDTSCLRSGHTQSCGCLRRKRTTKHGMSSTATYKAWCNMLNRCENSNTPKYKNWGGRGIKVCRRWHKFENFFADMDEMPENMTLERKDNDGNYCLENCCWATWKEQANNRRKRIPGARYRLRLGFGPKG